MMFAGENSIVIVPGANESLTPEHVDSAVDVIKSASVLLCQFEVPLETTLHALKLHQGHGSFLAHLISLLEAFPFPFSEPQLSQVSKDEVESVVSPR